MRAVLDTNVIISAAISPKGAPARVVAAWRQGEFELVVSSRLLEELSRALAYPKLESLIGAAEAEAILETVRREGVLVSDPDGPAAVRSRDPDDDYLLALASASGAALVSGDADLCSLGPELPIFSPAAFLAVLAEQAPGGPGS